MVNWEKERKGWDKRLLYVHNAIDYRKITGNPDILTKLNIYMQDQMHESLKWHNTIIAVLTVINVVLTFVNVYVSMRP